MWFDKHEGSPEKPFSPHPRAAKPPRMWVGRLWETGEYDKLPDGVKGGTYRDLHFDYGEGIPTRNIQVLVCATTGAIYTRGISKQNGYSEKYGEEWSDWVKVA